LSSKKGKLELAHPQGHPTRPEPHQQLLYNALGIPHLPGKTGTTLIDPRVAVSQM
jgi:hypothetical protein